MSNSRFYCPAKLALGAVVTLPPNAAIHATKVLRMQVGDEALLFNGDGYDYQVEFTFISKNEVNAKVKDRISLNAESPLNITLLQGISAGDRMDYTIQKAVEMGVNTIQPIATQRSVVKLNGDRAEKRREHWQNIVVSACEQSGRALVPEVMPPSSLANWLSTAPQYDLRITLSPYAAQAMHQLQKPQASICLLIGAEGGLTDEEIDLASLHQFIPVRLGNRILRTETAPIAAIAAMQTLWGDFN